MKKFRKYIGTVIINLAAIYLISVLIYLLTIEIKSLIASCSWLDEYKNMLLRKIENSNSIGNSIEEIQQLILSAQQSVNIKSIWLVIYSIAISACIFIFVYANPKLFRKTTYTDISAEWAKNKAERAAARSAKAESEKQKRIEKLQAEIDALHGDEKN